MAQHYEVGEGKTLIIRGPANIIVKTGSVPVVGSGDDLQPPEPDVAPTVTSLDPAEAESGSPDFILTVTGSGFTEDSVIVFGSADEPTTFISETGVSTGVKPGLFAPAEVPVAVKNGEAVSEPVTFTFTEAGAATSSKKRRS